MGRRNTGCDLMCMFNFNTGFGDRLLSEVKKLAPKDIKIRVCKISLLLCF
jgi:hypothetical protein